MDLGLRDEIAVITGASIGIGLAVAKGLAAKDVHIVVATHNSQRLGMARVEVASVAESRAVGVACGVATPAGVATPPVAAAEREFGGTDILINDAGTGSSETIMDAADDKGGDWRSYIDRLAKENARIGRFASPEEVADFVVFLCSAHASYSVGSTYFVNGGMLKTIWPLSSSSRDAQFSHSAYDMNPNCRYPSSTDVARLASVSQSAVSRAFSEGKSISPETGRKVFAAAKKLGYSPNSIPRILRKHRSHLVAVVIDGTDNPLYRMALEELTRGLQHVGNHALLVHVDGHLALDGVVPRLAGYRVDGIVSALPVLSLETASAFARFRIPTISFNISIKNRWVASVCCDNAGAAAGIAEVFVRRGTRSFAFVAGSRGSRASAERLRGYRERLADLGFKRVEKEAGDYLFEGGCDTVLALRARGKLPEAIFCANDLMAMGALDTLRLEVGLRMPEDVLIAGFDDAPEASWRAYELTTVVRDVPAMVAQALSILQSMASSRPSDQGQSYGVPGRVVERETTAR